MSTRSGGTFSLLVGVLLLTAGWTVAGDQKTAKSTGSGAPLDRSHDEAAQTVRDEASALTESVSRELALGPQGKVERKNLIDEHIFGKMERDNIPHAGLSSDEEFLRRIYIDLWGKIPPPDKIREFVKDETTDKRDKLIEEMMGLRYEIDPNDPYQGKAHGPWLVDAAFLHKWTYWFGDLFQNSRAQLGDGRNAFRDYIYLSLKLNIPYSEFVRRMLTATSLTGATSGPANLLLRDHVDDAMDIYINHEDTLDEIAISTAKYFLGLNLGCVSCHDGAGHLDDINLYLTQKKRVDLWNQAAFFGNIRVSRPAMANQEFTLLEGPAMRPEEHWHMGGHGYDTKAPSIVRIPRYRADVEPAFYVTGEKPTPGRNPREEFARMLIDQPQFARATVNWIWSELMVVGIVDPPHDFDLLRQDPANPPPEPWTIQPTHPALLNALAEDFRRHNFDLRRLISLIVKSSAYQLSSRFDGEWKPEYADYYARRFVRRLSAEELFDGISEATQVFPELAINGTDKKVSYVRDTYSSEDITDTEMKRFLSFFGQSNRDKQERDLRGSIVQATLLLNSDLIRNKVLRTTEGSRVAELLCAESPLSTAQLVEELFLATLSRFPTAGELALAEEMLGENVEDGAEDLQWALLNKRDFIFNY
jgi:hypothetical protein